MPDEVTIREDLEVIHVKSYNDVTIEDLIKSMRKIEEIKKLLGYTKIYVDASTQTSMPPTTSIFEFGETITKVLFGTKMAIYVSDNTRDDVMFLESVAGNRGAIIRLFDTEDSAIEWLLREG